MLSLMYEILEQAQANMIFCMLVSIPIAYIMSLLPNKYLILALSISVTYTIQSFLFPFEKYFLWTQQAIVYVLLMVAPRRFVGVAILIQSFVYLSAIQLRRMMVSYGDQKIDITGILMMQTFCYVGLGFNYQNGRLPDEKLRPDEIQRVVRQKPDILTYIGFLWYTPACLVGPVYQYKDYQNYLNRKGDFQSIPNTIPAAIKEIGIFIVGTAVHFAMGKFNMDYLTTQEYTSLPLIVRLFVIHLPVWHSQLKYIVAWSLAISAVKASGLGYQIVKDKDGKTISNFQRIRMNSIIAFFFNPSFKVKADSWNISVQQALKKYIYDQVYFSKDVTDQKIRRKQQTKGQYATLITSALWHGLYPAYYITFFNWIFVLQIVQQVFRLRKKWPKFDTMYNTMKIGHVCELIFSNYYMAYYGQIFLMMTAQRFMVPIYATYYIPGFLLYVIWFFGVQMGFIAKLGKKKDKTEKQALQDSEKKKLVSDKSD